MVSGLLTPFTFKSNIRGVKPKMLLALGLDPILKTHSLFFQMLTQKERWSRRPNPQPQGWSRPEV